MLQFFMRYQTGYMGLIGSLWQNRTTVPELLLAVVYILIPYLLGSVNTAIIVSGKFYRDDIRNYGSGNAGFTNIMRIYGKRAAIFTFASDIIDYLRDGIHLRIA